MFVHVFQICVNKVGIHHLQRRQTPAKVCSLNELQMFVQSAGRSHCYILARTKYNLRISFHQLLKALKTFTTFSDCRKHCRATLTINTKKDLIVRHATNGLVSNTVLVLRHFLILTIYS